MSVRDVENAPDSRDAVGSMTSSLPDTRGQKRRTENHASLSVVVLSTGTSTDTDRATQTLGSASRDMGAQLIVVSPNAGLALVRTAESNGAEFVVAPPGCSRAEMCDLGMRHAVGSIVVMREDAMVSDARWLDAYRAVLGQGTKPARSVAESVVMDTMMTDRTELADRRFHSVDMGHGGDDPSVELASTT